MKNHLFVLLLLLISIVFSNSAFAGRCSGGAYCTACSNCSSCKNCSENGGSCSVCSNYDEPESQAEYVPVSAVESKSNDSDNIDNYISEYDTPKKEESSYSWIWWIVGIFGSLLFLVSLGKK